MRLVILLGFLDPFSLRYYSCTKVAVASRAYTSRPSWLENESVDFCQVPFYTESKIALIKTRLWKFMSRPRGTTYYVYW